MANLIKKERRKKQDREDTCHQHQKYKEAIPTNSRY